MPLRLASALRALPSLTGAAGGASGIGSDYTADAGRILSTNGDGARERDSRGAILHQHPYRGGLSCRSLS
jgi:hypothetical protein